MLIPVTEGITVVAPLNKPRYPYANCMYIEADRPTVIDMGAGAKAFQEIPCDRIQLGLITHFHFDHLHGYDLFAGAEVMVSQEEKRTYCDYESYIDFHGYNLWDEIMSIPRQAYGQVVPLQEDVLARPGFRTIPLANTFSDGQKIDLGNMELTAVHLPGHTIGHYGFYFEKEGILFSGDIDLVATGPWYSSNSASVTDLIKSVRRIKEIDPRIVVPSHRRMQTQNLPKQLDQYIGVVIARNHRLLDILIEPHTLDQLADYHLIFPDYKNTYELFWEKMTLRNHLQHLIQQHLVQELPDGIYQRL
ncbi:MAG: MBL fold metallo-hydrolase [Syntrophomonadaceae bacterium]|jgi:ribonuclease/clavin/mitogillin|nr:MBL fold metallo-hydrolase [Bacillota bacterium]NLP22919.1 MBL fold metallo-hydrolase [Syntrophomonadaceae bacterium]